MPQELEAEESCWFPTKVPTLSNSPQTPLPLLWGQSAKTRDSKDTKGLVSPVKSCLAQAVGWAVGKVSVRVPECQHWSCQLVCREEPDSSSEADSPGQEITTKQILMKF